MTKLLILALSLPLAAESFDETNFAVVTNYAGVGVDGDTQAEVLKARTLRGEYISAGLYDSVTGIKLIAGSEPARQHQISLAAETVQEKL